MSPEANKNTNSKSTTPAPTPATDCWHVAQQTSGHCEIFNQTELDQLTQQPPKIWGPFASRAEAIAKRVGLIRAGKCLPK